MNRFLLFAGPNYYPSGGWDEFECAFDKLPSRERVLDVLKVKGHADPDWWHVVDTATLNVVLSDCDS